ncbi:FecR family protein [Pseudorhodoferax sp.]|uniref:FecR family protein n=1 Tax=Pseudorhodoferax sp. TaxID=1993553 RepID=UPI0039E635B9
MTAPHAPSPPPAAPAQDGAGAQPPLDDALLDHLPPAEFEALRWSVRAADGLDAPARAEFEAWLAAAPAHRAAYEDLAGVWSALDAIPPAGKARLRAAVAIDAAAASSARDVARQAQAGAAPAPPPAHPARRRLAQALAAATALGVLGGWLGWNRWQGQPVFSRHYATERGRSLDVALPDGSGLVLDTATRVEVTLYRQRHEVRLPEGQVLFRVQPNRSRHFDVLAGAARVTVLGTQFSVRYTPSQGSQAVQVAVIEGRVRVASNRAGTAAAPQAVEIVAGQAVAADAQGRLGPVSQVAAGAIAGWRRQRLDFDGAPLAQVLAEIARYGDIGVRLHDAAVGRLPITASVDLRNPGAFVQALPQVLPVRLERRGGDVEIVAGPR